MRTTVEFEPDTAAAVDEFRRERGVGTSEAVNELIRRALLPRQQRSHFTQSTHPLGLRIDVSNVADALESLEGADNR